VDSRGSDEEQDRDPDNEDEHRDIDQDRENYGGKDAKDENTNCSPDEPN
jgi:hypothetical protein